jgi:hypothetical protein
MSRRESVIATLCSGELKALCTRSFNRILCSVATQTPKYKMTLRDTIWKLWRNAPDFSSRFTGTFGDNGDTIIGVWELSEDGSTWKRDLELTYTLVK